MIYPTHYNNLTSVIYYHNKYIIPSAPVLFAGRGDETSLLTEELFTHEMLLNKNKNKNIITKNKNKNKNKSKIKTMSHITIPVKPAVPATILRKEEHNITAKGNAVVKFDTITLDGDSTCNFTTSGNSQVLIRNVNVNDQNQIIRTSMDDSQIRVRDDLVTWQTFDGNDPEPQTQRVIYCGGCGILFFILFWLALYDVI